MTFPRLLFLPSSYLPDAVGGTEIYAHWLATELTSKNAEVAVAYHSAKAAGAGFPYSVVSLPSLRQPLRSELYSHSLGEVPPGFGELLDRFRPDVVHFHAFSLGAGLDHAREAKRRGIPYVVTYHLPQACARGTLLKWGTSPCDGVIEPAKCASCALEARGVPKPLAVLAGQLKLPHTLVPEGPWLHWVALNSLLARARHGWLEFLNGAEHVVACADWAAEMLAANGVSRDRMSVSRQALPGKRRRRRLKYPPKGKTSFTVGWFGRFTRIKGPDLVAAAVERLNEKGMACRAELVGPTYANEDAWRNALLARSPHSRHLGVKRGQELGEWIRGLDAVAIPSRWLETGPLTLLEAWNEGVPVVGTDLGGIREFMMPHGLSEFLVPLEDAEALADRLAVIISRAGTEGPEVELPGMADLADKMLELYSSVLPSMTSRRSR